MSKIDAELRSIAGSVIKPDLLSNSGLVQILEILSEQDVLDPDKAHLFLKLKSEANARGLIYG